jgi:hypothetical protein
MASPSKSFHNSYDIAVNSYQTYTVDGWQKGSYITLRNRSLDYLFFAHFHPYVLPLIQRLNEGGIGELEDSDTLYLPQPSGGPLTVIPNSTRAALLSAVTAHRPDATSVSLSAGTPLTLPDGTPVRIAPGTLVAHPDGTTSKLAGATSVPLPGKLPVSSSSGIQWNVGGKQIIVPDYTPVRLTGDTLAVLTHDGSSVNLPNGTEVAIRSGQPQPVLYERIFDASHYDPDPGTVQQPYPVKNLDFSLDGAYSIYNWELFFHAPLLIAIHLSQNQKFQDAQRWFHYIFNPTDNSNGPTPERFWRVQPFQSNDVKMIEEILVNLSTNQDPQLYQQTVSSINNWRENPFQPFAIGKYRPTAFMLKTVMAYLDNLIAWGDSLFRQYSIETINEATQLYVMAANILGPKPQAVPKKGSVKPLTYNDLRGKLDEFGNAMVDMEVDMPFDIAPSPSPGTDPKGTQILASIGQTLYFCIPRNDKLLRYWTTVADRLFKIHNSLNLQGVFQQPPLFEPPIDPALLVRAAAAGLDVNAIVSGLNQPLPLVRFQLLVSKAAEICQEVKNLGANILAAMEKQDNESLSLIRAQHEKTILRLAEVVKYSQWQDAVKARQGLEHSLAKVSQQYIYYQKMLGSADNQIQIPSLDSLDEGSLENLKFSQAAGSSEPQMTFDPINPDISQDSTSVSDGEITTLSSHEVEELEKMKEALIAQGTATGLEALGSVLAIIPQFEANAQPMGCGLTVDFGGQHLHSLCSSLASASKVFGEVYSYQANKAGKLGSYSRRQYEWLSQSNQAKGEINQIFKQLRGAQIREAITAKEFENHQTQMQYAQEIVDFLQGKDAPPGFQVKETTTGFYAWMKREVKALYAKSFQLAFEVAKKAERGLQHELGDPTLSYIQYNYLDGTEGLLAGEKLLFDVKAMEMAYHDLNQREFEMTKHVSLLQVDPLALVQLRATGTCILTLPEDLFDMDGPGHYFRRIKSVALTIPCVTGPYTSVNCTLTLQKSSIRTSTDLGDGYHRKGSEDPRFNDYYGSLQSIVTSSGQSDSGLFETNLRDERYLPFEGAGITDSQWQLTLPADVRQFDFDTISDVILHVRYTSRQGGEALKAAAVQNLQKQIKAAQAAGSVRLFSIRHEFPTEWARFKRAVIDVDSPTATLALNFLPQHYPFWTQGLLAAGSVVVKEVDFFAEMTDKTVSVNIYDEANKSGKNEILAQNPLLNGLLNGSLSKIAKPDLVTADPTKPFTLYFDNNLMKELWLAITWGT